MKTVKVASSDCELFADDLKVASTQYDISAENSVIGNSIRIVCFGAFREEARR